MARKYEEYGYRIHRTTLVFSIICMKNLGSKFGGGSKHHPQSESGQDFGGSKHPPLVVIGTAWSDFGDFGEIFS